MRDTGLTVEINAETLHNLTALAAGYTMSRGNFISRSVIREANRILSDSDYEYGVEDDTLF